MGGFLDSIGSFFSGIYNGVADIVRKIWSAIEGVWTFLWRLFDNVVKAVVWLFNGIYWLGEQAADAIGNAATAIWHIVTNIIPNAIEWLGNKLLSAIETAAKAAAAFATSLVNDAKRALTTAFNALVNGIKDGLKAALGTIATLWNWFGEVGATLLDWIEHPDHLASFIAGSIILPVLRWLLTGVTSVVVWVWQLFTANIQSIAHLIEDALSEII